MKSKSLLTSMLVCAVIGFCNLNLHAQQPQKMSPKVLQFNMYDPADSNNGNPNIVLPDKSKHLKEMLVTACDLTNYQSATIVGPSDFPYTSPGSGITVNATSNTPTLSNTSYSCGGNTFATAPTAWWISSTSHLITLNFSDPVSSFSVVVNGTNQNEIFTFNAATGSVTLSNFCTSGFSDSGSPNQLLSTGAPTTGTLITVNNAIGATEYTITHNGVGAGSRISLFDCFMLSGPFVDPVNNVQVCAGAMVSEIVFSGHPDGTFNWTNDNTAIGLGAGGTGNIPAFMAANVTSQEVANITVTPELDGEFGTPISFTITVNPNPTLVPGTVTNPGTCGASNGSIAFTTTNLPDGTYSLVYSGAGSPQNVSVAGNAFVLSGLGAGTYSNFSITHNTCTGTVAGPVTLEDPMYTWYQDMDDDGYGNPLVSTQSCLQPMGYVADNTDCNDNDDTFHPNATETCDGCDKDCDGFTGDGVQQTPCGLPTPPNCAGVLVCPVQAVPYPGACLPGGGGGVCNNNPQPEVCDGIDNNCNGEIDENVPTIPCVPAGTPPGLVYGGTSQCQMGQFICVNGMSVCVGFVGPSEEICDGIDNDCDGQVDEGGVCCAGPVANCKSYTAVLDAAGQTTIVPANVNDGSTYDCGLQSITVAPSQFNCSHIGPQTVTLTVTDVNGNSDDCTATVTVADNTKPNISCPGNQEINVGANCSITLSTWSPASLSDNCTANPTVSQSPVAGTVLSGHNTVQTVTLTANDGNGNTETCQFTVTLKDNTKPNISCPGNQELNAGANCSATLSTWSPASLSDNCTANPTVIQSPAAGTVLSGHNTVQTVTLTAIDGTGNTETCQFTVTLKDNTKPGITCPGNQELNAAANCSATLGAWSPASLSDNCTANPTVTQSPAAGTVFSGTQTVTLTANDGNGNTETCQFTVTAVDIGVPTITCPNPVTVTCTANVPPANPNSVTANDNCGTPVVTHVGDVTSGMTCANRKTITRTYRATDDADNSTTCVQVITVFDNVAPVFTSVPGNVTVQCNSIPAVGNPAASDGCGGSVSIQYNGQTVSNVLCTDKYTLTRQWTATDACGNTKTATQRIVVTDTQKPDFTSTPANITVQCDAIPAATNPTATDNCDVDVAVTYNGQTTTSGACPNAYTLTRRWTAADNCNNTRSISQRITVVDNGKPVFTSFPGNTTIACNETPPAVGSPTASDACGNATVTYLGQTTVSGSCPSSYQIKRTWRATDVCGNSTVSTQTIQVSDNGVPVFTSVPGPLTIECSDPLPPLVNPTASDACGGYVHITFLGNVPSGSGCSADYTVTRTWRADDLCGNTATASQVITVLANNNYGDPEGVEYRDADSRPQALTFRRNMHIQPNPTTDRIWLDLSDFAGEAVTVSVFSDLRQLVWENRVPIVENLQLSLSLREAGAAAGLYTISVRSAGEVIAKRVALIE